MMSRDDARAAHTQCAVSVDSQWRGVGLPPKAFEPDPNLEAALERLLQGIRQSRGG
jgi:hypothetical protein